MKNHHEIVKEAMKRRMKKGPEINIVVGGPPSPGQASPAPTELAGASPSVQEAEDEAEDRKEHPDLAPEPGSPDHADAGYQEGDEKGHSLFAKGMKAMLAKKGKK